jgi:hypothetical protein
MTLGEPIIRQKSHCTYTLNLNAILNNTLLLVTPYMHKTHRAASSVFIHNLLAFDGRCITLYQEVHSVKTKAEPAIH